MSSREGRIVVWAKGSLQEGGGARSITRAGGYALVQPATFIHEWGASTIGA